MLKTIQRATETSASILDAVRNPATLRQLRVLNPSLRLPGISLGDAVGKTFRFDPDLNTYVVDSSATNAAPGTARFLLYAVDTVLGEVVLPLEVTGSADLTPLAGSDSSVTVRIASGGKTMITYAADGYYRSSIPSGVSVKLLDSSRVTSVGTLSGSRNTDFDVTVWNGSNRGTNSRVIGWHYRFTDSNGATFETDVFIWLYHEETDHSWTIASRVSFPDPLQPGGVSVLRFQSRPGESGPLYVIVNRDSFPTNPNRYANDVYGFPGANDSLQAALHAFWDMVTWNDDFGLETRSAIRQGLGPATSLLQALGTPTGNLQVMTNSTGGTLDPDGYLAVIQDLDVGFTKWIRASATPTNGTTNLNSIAIGRHRVELRGIPGNCSVDNGPTRDVYLTMGETSAVTFNVNCGP